MIGAPPVARPPARPLPPRAKLWRRVVAPIVVAPLALVALERAGRRVAVLLHEVELTRAQLLVEVAERKAAQSKLEELVRRDPLTGLLNWRGLFDFWQASSGQNLVLFIGHLD